ncbi:TPA: sugar phosphate isomerase/epimerase [Candidatus Bathyarchaeota archaeon]|nr:sugar phosphate isomerase/epimerase [Candidatus Bathyarchaeota archaeon]
MYVAVRDATLRYLGYKNVFSGLKDLGVKSCEFMIDENLALRHYVDAEASRRISLSSKTSCRNFIEKLEFENISICALLVNNRFTMDDFQADVKRIIKVCRLASDLNVKVVRINPIMKSSRELLITEYAEFTARCIREVISKTKEEDVYLAMENHGLIGNDIDYIRKVIDLVNSERMGLTLDIGNIYWFGYPLDQIYDIIEEFAIYVKHTHVKNLAFSKEKKHLRRKPGEGYPKTAAPLYIGDIDLYRVIKILNGAGYNEDLTVEDESIVNFPSREQLNVIKKDIEYLRNLIYRL